MINYRKTPAIFFVSFILQISGKFPGFFFFLLYKSAHICVVTVNEKRFTEILYKNGLENPPLIETHFFLYDKMSNWE